MRDRECVELMQPVLARLGLRWEGFRRVRKQVCKRLGRRMAALGLSGPDEYRRFLEAHPEELAVFDGLARVSITRFYRDRAVHDALATRVLPRLASEARARGEASLRVWSAGCAGGEEPYTLALIWRWVVGPQQPGLDLEVVATDADPVALARARAGCYRGSSLVELPAAWRAGSFTRRGDLHCLSDEVRASVDFHCQDLRGGNPAGPFHAILCRNLAFTYFAEPVQSALLPRLVALLVPGGALVIGARERLPTTDALVVDPELPCLFRAPE